MSASEVLTPPARTESQPRRAPANVAVVDRMAAGKSLRTMVPRRSHGAWSPPPNRPDPIELLQAQDRTREPDLVPIRYGRMLVSPFSFYRGSAAIMASDLATTPASGITIQICGDAHLSNFGTFATPERTLVFDLNDFDETLPAPWEWDLKRLVASIVVAGRQNGFAAADCTAAALAAVAEYRQRISAFAPMSHLAVWYSDVTADDILATLPPAVAKDMKQGIERAKRSDRFQALAKMTTAVDGTTRIVEQPPLIVREQSEATAKEIATFLKTYRSTLRDDVSALLQRYTLVDRARKVVGVGSVGTRCHIALFRGNGDDDPLFLQVKEASASVLEPFAGKSRYPNHGQRVVRGQHHIQAASDIFLGWGRYKDRDFYIRQLRDMKGSFDIARFGPDRLLLYARLCAWALARGHAVSGHAAEMAGYMGNADTFDNAIVAFANDYADQNERDYEALVAAVKAGRVNAVTGV